MTLKTVYQDRDNPIVLELLQDGEAPAPGITKVQARIGDVCIGTDTDPTEISLSDNVLTLVLGHKDLSEGTHKCALTVYDINHPNGIAWSSFWVKVKPWEACA